MTLGGPIALSSNDWTSSIDRFNLLLKYSLQLVLSQDAVRLDVKYLRKHNR